MGETRYSIFVPSKSPRTGKSPQAAWLKSEATMCAFGGAMAGGKSRTLCERAFRDALKYPGMQQLIVRQKHTAIVETTRKTMFEKVLGPLGGPGGPMVVRKKESMGEDWIDIATGTGNPPSRINFVGLDDPGKWFSAEIGAAYFDEAHEMALDDVLQIITRLRQSCAACAKKPTFDAAGVITPCEHFPHRAFFAFNPGNPGHWLQDWFIAGAVQTEYGYYKAELYASHDNDDDAQEPLGDAEFVFSNAYDNVHLPPKYISRTLASLPKLRRQQLLEGQWVLIDGSLFFDAEALTAYLAETRLAWKQGDTDGNPAWPDKRDPPRVRVRARGPLSVWKPPVRNDPDTGTGRHRYVIGGDVSSGGGSDYSALQVLDADTLEQVAEYQAKIDPDLLAVEMFRLGIIYNGALLAPEITGGYGHSVVRKLERLLIEYAGDYDSKPQIYMARDETHLAKRLTTALGWNTSTATRQPMLDRLEEAIREHEITLYGARTVEELRAFGYPKLQRQAGQNEKVGKPQAVAGKHDDLVISLAIAFYLCATGKVKARRKQPQQRYEPLVASTGY